MQPAMNTCTVVAPSVLKAMRLLREELSPEAFVVSCTMTAAGVEVVGSVHEPAPREGSVSVAPKAAGAWPIAPAPACNG